MPVHRITVQVDLPNGNRLSFKCNDTRLTPDRSKFHLYGVTLTVNGKRVHGVKGGGTMTNPHPERKPGQRPPVKAITYRLAHAIAVHLGHCRTKSAADKQVAEWYAVADHCDVRRQRTKEGLERLEVWIMDDEDSIVAVLAEPGMTPGKAYRLAALRYDKTATTPWPDESLSIASFTTEKPD